MLKEWWDRRLRPDKDINWFLQHPDSLQAGSHALRIAAIYLVVGSLWILVSDAILFVIFPDPNAYHMAQRFKGWFYVAATAVMLYGLIHWRMELLSQAAQTIGAAYEDLQAAHEELVAAESELRYQKDMAQHLVDDAPAIILLWQLDGKIIELNPYGQKLLEVDRSPDELPLPELLGTSTASLAKSLVSGEAVVSELGPWEAPSGRQIYVWWNSRLITDPSGGEEKVVSVGTDITQQRELEGRLQRLAYYDNLTQLPNRQRMQETMDQWIAAERPFTLILMDLDHFQDINDTLGHDIGDLFLQHAAQQLRSITRDGEVLARMGGDEFGMLWPHVTDPDQIQGRTQEIFEVFGPWQMLDHEFMMSLSAGVAVYPRHGDTSVDLVKNCDTALNNAKKEGRNRFFVYSEDVQERNVAAIKMSSAIRRAMEQNEFELYYQPHIHLETGAILGAEALIRWPQADGSFVGPPDFIPLAEDTGQIYDIDLWVLQQAINEMKELAAAGYPHLVLSVNISSRTINQPQALRQIVQTIAAEDVDPQRLVLEVTETAILDRDHSAAVNLQQLKDLGVYLALDDFGTGYSSLEYVSNWPIEVIKMDRSFIDDIGVDEKKEAVIAAVLRLAATLQYRVVAEGIETEEQRTFLMQRGCSQGQGYLFHRPMTKEHWRLALAASPGPDTES